MMWCRAIGVAGWLRLTTLAAAAAVTVLVPGPARAQSAADKATARQLAYEGIELYNGGKYEAALDKLQRAQSLYDAPIHLLYIARCQERLGKLVESAESYRQLSRVRLDEGAPEAFRQAKQEGAQELEALEPKIPTLRIEVAPANLQGLQLSIDGAAVSSAVIGVDRPINPGQHRIEVAAPGYEHMASTVAVAKGEKKTAKLELKPAAAPTPVPPGQQLPPGQYPPGQQPPTAQQYPGQPPPGQPPPPAEEPGGVGFLLGLRLTGVIPLGDMDSNLGEAFPNGFAPGSDSEGLEYEEISFSDVAKGGGGLELQFGIRFAKYFTPFLLGGYYGLSAAEGLERLGFGDMDYEREGAAEGVESTPSMMMGGLGLRVGTARGQLGGYGEATFAMHLFQAKQTVTFFGDAYSDCELTRSYMGGAFRLGGGAAIPIGNVFQLSPFAMASLGKFTHAEVKAECLANQGYTYDPKGQIHVLLAIGVGGEFLFGADKPPEALPPPQEQPSSGPPPEAGPPPAAAPPAAPPVQ